MNRAFLKTEDSHNRTSCAHVVQAHAIINSNSEVFRVLRKPHAADHPKYEASVVSVCMGMKMTVRTCRE